MTDITPPETISEVYREWLERKERREDVRMASNLLAASVTVASKAMIARWRIWCLSQAFWDRRMACAWYEDDLAESHGDAEDVWI